MVEVKCPGGLRNRCAGGRGKSRSLTLIRKRRDWVRDDSRGMGRLRSRRAGGGLVCAGRWRGGSGFTRQRVNYKDGLLGLVLPRLMSGQGLRLVGMLGVRGGWGSLTRTG